MANGFVHARFFRCTERNEEEHLYIIEPYFSVTFVSCLPACSSVVSLTGKSGWTNQNPLN
jgi:hypothetical protein